MKELEARPAEEFGDKTLREENRQFLRLAEETAQQTAAGKTKRRLMEEQMLRLREEERCQVDRKLSVWLDTQIHRWNHELTKLQAGKERAQEELIIHAKNGCDAASAGPGPRTSRDGRGCELKESCPF